MARLVFLCALSSLVGCGARSGLEGDGRRDLGPDEGTPPGDFGPDASSDDLGCEASGPEVCDGLDQDCDGRVDEGTLSECRDCRPGCTILELPGELGAPWLEVAEVAEGVEAGRDGALRLAEDDRTEAAFAWVANTEFGTLTKLDLETGRQLGEFDSVLRDGSNRARPPLERCDQDRSRGNCPSRTAVDLRGGVFVANRAFGNQGTVTRIAGQLDDCRDRDGDGRIETSADLDGDGIIERSVPGEYLGQDDECLLWTVDVGAFGGLPRAVAIDAEGEVWVGLYEGREVVELDPDDGDVLRSVPLRGGFTPYGAAVDSAGTLWLTTAATGQIAGVDTREGTQFRDTIIPEVVSRD
ncbi:MAG: MopE-related protein, partial [Myxococcota bacterium]